MPEFLGKKVSARQLAGGVMASIALGAGIGGIKEAAETDARPAAVASAQPSQKKSEASTSAVPDPVVRKIPETTTTIDLNVAAKIAEAQLGTTTTTEVPKTSTSIAKTPSTTAEVQVGDPADTNNSNGSIERDGPVDRESVMRAADEFKNMIIDDVTNKRGTDGGSQNLDQVDEQTGDRTVIFVSNFTNEDGTTGFYQNRAVVGRDGVTKVVTVGAYMGNEQSGDDPVLAAQLSLTDGTASYTGQDNVAKNLDTNAAFTTGYANGRNLADAARAAQPLQAVVLQPIA